MNSNSAKLETVKAFASILSTVAVPIVLAISGYWVQKNIAEDGVKKDYVSVAMGILRNDGGTPDPELKRWAVAVVTKYSPVPFSEDAKRGLESIRYIEPAIPELPSVAKQAQRSESCEPSCSRRMADQLNMWKREIMTVKSDAEAFQALKRVLDASIQQNILLAKTADMGSISGQACERIYEGLRANQH